MSSSSTVMGHAPDTGSLPINISADIPSATTIRHAHLGAEANVKAAGTILLVEAVLCLFASLIAFYMAPIVYLAEPHTRLIQLVIILVYGSTGLFLRSFNPAGRLYFTVFFILKMVATAAVVSSLFGGIILSGPPSLVLVIYATTVAIPILSFVFHCFLLYILWRRKEYMVTSARYQNEIVGVTWHLYFPSRTSTVTKVFVLMIALLVVWLLIVLGSIA